MEKFLPDIDLFPRLTKVGAFLARLVRFLPENAPMCMSEHFEPARGAEADLDAALYDHPQLPFPVTERPEAAQLERSIVNRWDDQGNYHDAEVRIED
ncbi:hypothetical protein [Caudoviricetes sp.]|nr:hypothetical protein [Caudoviricetes sp.]